MMQARMAVALTLVLVACAGMIKYTQVSRYLRSSEVVDSSLTLKVIELPTTDSPKLIVSAVELRNVRNTYRLHLEPEKNYSRFARPKAKEAETTEVTTESRYPAVSARIMPTGYVPRVFNRSGRVVLDLQEMTDGLSTDKDMTVILTSGTASCSAHVGREVAKAVRARADSLRKRQLYELALIQKEEEKRARAEEAAAARARADSVRKRRSEEAAWSRNVDIAFGMSDASLKALIGEPTYATPWEVVWEYPDETYLKCRFEYSHVTGTYNLVAIAGRSDVCGWMPTYIGWWGDLREGVVSGIFPKTATGRFRRRNRKWYYEYYCRGQRLWDEFGIR